ncbi:MAG TPA: DegV family protein [Syntrophomonadaceae bacterium]|nr:DegV family protein [Syntrophomonadaceae bacterium]
MARIGFVTDSTAYLPREFKEEFQIEVVSLTINFEGESYPEEGLYEDFADFYERLSQVPYLPTTSQPSVGDFLQAYERLAGRVESIISVHITGGISGTVKTARSAAQMLPELDITVIDSRITAVGLYTILEAAARAAAAGLGKGDVLQIIDHIVEHQLLLFIPATLEYLRRGGRIGGAAALIGNLLQIKPILFFNPAKNNIIDLYDKVRTKEKAIQRVLAEMEKKGAPLKTVVGHVNAEQEGRNLVERVKALHPEYSPELCPVGPVIGTHIGPGAMGLCFYPLTPQLEKLVKF